MLRVEGVDAYYGQSHALQSVSLTVGPGEFVWREPGSRHAATTPEGGLMIAMFQIPNKFFAADGRITDQHGCDWDELWGEIISFRRA